MIATLLQFAASTDKDANIAAIQQLVDGAATGGQQLIVLPENAMFFDQQPGADYRAAAEPVDGRFRSAIADLASQHRVTIVAGMTEAPAPGETKVTNTVVVLDPEGSLVGAYRKVHLYDAFGYRESDYVVAHEPRPLIVPVDDLRIGIMTCYDLRFPEMARYLVDAGADVIAVPAAWASGPGKEDHWVTLARARAIENTVYVLACGQSGPACVGRSVVIDPMGVVAAAAHHEVATVSTDVTADRIASVRASNPSLANRRFSVVPATAEVS